MKKKPLFFCITILISLFFVPIHNAKSDHSPIQMPEEYLRIRKIVNRLARFNDLGDSPLLFKVIAGSYTAFLGTSNEDDAGKYQYYMGLDPFKDNYDQVTTEQIKQGYLFGNWGAHAWTNGTIAISRSTFRVTKNAPRDSFLAFTIAHELAHVVDAHVFNEEKEFSIRQKKHKRKKSKNNLIRMEISRKYEALADLTGCEMMRNAGYQYKDCLNALKRLHESTGHGSLTQSTDTHPGYRDRRMALEKYMSEEDFNSRVTSLQARTTGMWEYDTSSNILTFTPKKMDEIS